MFFDSHCHLDDPRFSPHLAGIIAEAEAAGVSGFLVPGLAPGGWAGIETLAASHPRIFPSFGVHPMHADLLTPQTLSELRRLSNRATAIGEIGLDYTLPAPSRPVQQEAFRAQLVLAAEAGLPVLVHCRKAFEDLLRIMRETGIERHGGVMHAFSGSPETAASCLGLGLHISLAGSVTYHNARRPVRVAQQVPLERLLLETDAPDLAPEPFRGGLNLPCYLVHTAAMVAQLKGVTLAQLAQATTANAQRLFRLQQARQSPNLSN